MPTDVKLQSPTPRNRASTPTAVLLGFGYCARAVYPLLIAQGYDVIVTKRGALKPLGDETIKVVEFDGIISPALADIISSAEIIISSIPPNAQGDPFINALVATPIAAPHLRWAGYLSATSVYGDRAGQWAFEDELLRPVTARGRARVEAELAWLETGWPVHIFRLAGIYGPEIMGVSRHPFDKIQSGTARAIIKPGHVVNRIHVDDIARALISSIGRPDPAQVYNLADGHPAPPQDVLNFAAMLLGVAPPPQTDLSDPSLSKMVRSFYGETKRIDISRAHRDLGWRPQYPDYQSGLRAIVATLKRAEA